jgi:hypothetical protein
MAKSCNVDTSRQMSRQMSDISTSSDDNSDAEDGEPPSKKVNYVDPWRKALDNTDKENGWVKNATDQSPNLHCFTAPGPCHNMNLVNHTPEEFFSEMFDEKMWSIMSDLTNQYVAHTARLSWTATTPQEMKVFVAHIIAMGIIKKPTFDSYWSPDFVTYMPFFGTYMSQDRFMNILWNWHVYDKTDKTRPKFGTIGHDPLYQVREMVDMMARNFKIKYRPNKAVAFDDCFCPFITMASTKKNTFSSKLYTITDATTGYISGFEVYTWKGSRCSDDVEGNLGWKSKQVIGLLQSVDCLDSGYHVYLDTRFNSPELLNALHARNTHGCGTVQCNRKGLPQSVVRQFLKAGEAVYGRKGHLLALQWKYGGNAKLIVLSSIHSADEALSNKMDFKEHFDKSRITPAAVVDYNRCMSGHDSLIESGQYYGFLREKGVKFHKKLLIHFINMTVCNAHILHKQYGKEELTYEQFRHALVEYLVKSA